jgi:hypothetical protein
MSMDWFRWHHGTVTDPKWRVVAAESGQRLSDVLAVWAAMLEHASQNEARGSLAGWRDKVVAAALDLTPEAVEAIRKAMGGMVIDGEQLVGWRKRQPLSDVENRGRPCASDWGRIRSAIFARDEYTCRYCGARGVRLECDHVVPVARGGGHGDDNLVTACFPCNRSKHDKLVSEWKEAN